VFIAVLFFGGGGGGVLGGAMAASDGEERVLLTAQRIVKSLGTNDTMTDDMLQILSKFDHRFSSMNDKSKKHESTSSQESDELESIPPSSRTTLASNPTPLPPRKPSRKTSKSSLDRAEDVIIHWDKAYSEEARESMIFESPTEDALAYLGAVDKVQNVLESLTVHDTDPGMLERVQNLLQLAMVRLEEEFRNMLDKHSESVDPDWLLDCLSAGSFANIQDNAVRAAPESSGEDDDDEDDDDDDIPVAEPVGDLPSIVDLVLPEVALDLQNIAQRMVTAGFSHECCNVYVDVRKRVLEDSLYRLGVERLSIDEVQKLPWETQEDTIKKWNQAMKIGVKVLFASEKQLCDQVHTAHPFFGSLIKRLHFSAETKSEQGYILQISIPGCMLLHTQLLEQTFLKLHGSNCLKVDHVAQILTSESLLMEIKVEHHVKLVME